MEIKFYHKHIIENPENVRVGLEEVQNELQHANQALFDRLAIIQEQTKEYQGQLDRLLDLYLRETFLKRCLSNENHVWNRC